MLMAGRSHHPEQSLGPGGPSSLILPLRTGQPPPPAPLSRSRSQLSLTAAPVMNEMPTKYSPHLSPNRMIARGEPTGLMHCW